MGERFLRLFPQETCRQWYIYTAKNLKLSKVYIMSSSFSKSSFSFKIKYIHLSRGDLLKSTKKITETKYQCNWQMMDLPNNDKPMYHQTEAKFQQKSRRIKARETNWNQAQEKHEDDVHSRFELRARFKGHIKALKSSKMTLMTYVHNIRTTAAHPSLQIYKGIQHNTVGIRLQRHERKPSLEVYI